MLADFRRSDPVALGGDRVQSNLAEIMCGSRGVSLKPGRRVRSLAFGLNQKQLSSDWLRSGSACYNHSLEGHDELSRTGGEL